MTEKKIDKDLIYSTGVIAKILGVRPNTITKYPVAPIHKEGRMDFYNIREILEHVYRDDRREQIDLTHEKAQLVKVQAQRVRIQIETLKKKLLRASEVESVWTDFTSACRQKLLSVASRASDEVIATRSKEEVIKILKQHISDALSELKEFRLDDFSIDKDDLISNDGEDEDVLIDD